MSCLYLRCWTQSSQGMTERGNRGQTERSCGLCLGSISRHGNKNNHKRAEDNKDTRCEKQKIYLSYPCEEMEDVSFCFLSLLFVYGVKAENEA